MLHFLVDGVCACAMFGWFMDKPRGYLYILIYNFCAFALQMPLGAAMDLLLSRREENGSRKTVQIPFTAAMSGCALTVIGAFTSPLILGIGNALFHIGGGVGTIREDLSHDWKGAALGIFVAPGAMGLFIGMSWTDMHSIRTTTLTILVCALGMLILSILFLFLKKRWKYPDYDFRQMEVSPALPPGRQQTAAWRGMLFFAMLVVILRSWLGFALDFSWKTDYEMGFLAVLAIVLGKMLGGVLSARLGLFTASMASLLAAAVAFCFMDVPAGGLVALLAFQTTMPVTLALASFPDPGKAGFGFGLLTFGLFLGFLPVYFHMQPAWAAELPQSLLASMVCLFSMALLAAAIYLKECGERCL